MQAWPGQLTGDDAHTPAHPQLQLPTGFAATCWCHPDAYLNKLLIGAADGRLALVNFIAGSIVHIFPGFGCGVRCVCGSPALDVVAVGLSDGRCVLHNLRYDETLATFTHDISKGAVTALSFRTGAGTPLLAVGGVDGAISVWDLNARRVHSLVKEAHDAPVRTHTHCLVHVPLRSTEQAMWIAHRFYG